MLLRLQARERAAVDAAVANALAMSLRQSRLEKVAERQSELVQAAGGHDVAVAARLERAAEWVSQGNGHQAHAEASPYERVQAGLDGAAAWLAAHGSEGGQPGHVQGQGSPANSVAYAASLAANSISTTYANAYAASLANEAEAAQVRAALMSPGRMSPSVGPRELELD